MDIAVICAKCGKIHSITEDGSLLVDFRKKEFSFICQNKQCNHDNIMDFNTFEEKSKRSPLPRMRTL